MNDASIELTPQTRIYVAGHRGMVGSAVVRRLEAEGFVNVITRTRTELDLCDGAAVDRFLAEERPEAVIHAAARVGGIHANRTYPAQFLHENLAMGLHVIDGAWRHGCTRLLYLGSSCIYPREAPQPMPESCLLDGPLEPTNEGYALAKIAGLKLCQYYRKEHGVLFHSAMPTNLYGPGDNYHPTDSHVLPALIRRAHEAKERGSREFELWGTGCPRREFLHVDDLADAVLHILRLPDPPDWINVGTGEDVTIRELAERVMATVGLEAELRFDASKPDGTPRKLLDVSLLNAAGWRARIPLHDGLARTYKAFLSEQAEGRLRGG